MFLGKEFSHSLPTEDLTIHPHYFINALKSRVPLTKFNTPFIRPTTKIKTATATPRAMIYGIRPTTAFKIVPMLAMVSAISEAVAVVRYAVIKFYLYYTLKKTTKHHKTNTNKPQHNHKHNIT